MKAKVSNKKLAKLIADFVAEECIEELTLAKYNAAKELALLWVRNYKYAKKSTIHLWLTEQQQRVEELRNQLK